MRIALVIPGGYGPTAGGAGIPVLTAFAEALAGHHKVSVFSLTAMDAPGHAVIDTWHTARPRMTRLGIAQTARALYTRHRQTPFDLLHGFWTFPSGALAVMAGRLLGVPSVVTLQGAEVASVPELGYGDLLSRYQTRRNKLICRFADSVVLLTRFQERAFRHAGFPARQTAIIPWGVSAQDFPCTVNDPEPPLRFVNVGNQTEIKNQDLMLRVFARVAGEIPAHLTVAGPDHLQGHLPRLAARLGIADNIEFTGPQTQAEIAAHLRQAHFLLHTSLWESQCVAAVEAAMSGALVCGTPTGIIADRATTCVTAADEASLARAILRTARDHEQYRQLVQAARREALLQTSDWTTERYLNLYAKIKAARAEN